MIHFTLRDRYVRGQVVCFDSDGGLPSPLNLHGLVSLFDSDLVIVAREGCVFLRTSCRLNQVCLHTLNQLGLLVGFSEGITSLDGLFLGDLESLQVADVPLRIVGQCEYQLGVVV